MTARPWVFCRPMKARKRPMPALVASMMLRGTRRMRRSLSPARPWCTHQGADGSRCEIMDWL